MEYVFRGCLKVTAENLTDAIMKITNISPTIKDIKIEDLKPVKRDLTIKTKVYRIPHDREKHAFFSMLPVLAWDSNGGKTLAIVRASNNRYAYVDVDTGIVLYFLSPCEVTEEDGIPDTQQEVLNHETQIKNAKEVPVDLFWKKEI